MNICFILVLSIISQLVFGYFIKILFPGLIGVTWFSFLQIGILSVISVFVPGYLYLKKQKKAYFTDCIKDIKIDILIPLSFAIGVCSQYLSIASNLPVNYLISFLGKNVDGNVPQVTNFGLYLISLIVVCLMPAIFEEVLFRGIIFNKGREYGIKSAIILSSFLFAIMHFDFSNFFGTLVLGIIAGLMVKYTNRLIYPMITHFAMNFTSATLSFITNNEMIENLHNDLFFIFIIISIPLSIYLMRIFKEKSVEYTYVDEDKYELTRENIIQINEEESIRIIEHDIKENNIMLMLKELCSSVYFYIIVILFIYLGGAVFWN